MLHAVFNVAAFRALEGFQERGRRIRAISQGDAAFRRLIRVFYPGEVEYIREQQRKVAGIDVEDATWDKLRQLAGEYKLAAELDLA